MQEILFPFVGGLGLFLIGMMLLSEGLVAFGGPAMKQALSRFTGTPGKAFASGALATMIVQSSSATTVTLIGFVSAGLITFSQAIGVLIGASLGNTATGWIVAGLGLKVNLGFYTLPLVGLGSMLKLMGKGRAQDLGLAMAGFGLMFVGLNTLQEGMRGLASVFNLATLPVGGYGARITTMLIGLTLTAILQSSTAAIATTLTALHTQTINFDQAAALVVGAAIGTTLTGALVTIGGTLYAKRTALAYILFNAVAGVLAIALLPAFFWLIEWLMLHAGLDAGATSLAMFHTLFIALGVVLFMPFVPQFAALVERILPERQAPTPSQRLDASMLSIPAVALEATQRTLEHSTAELLALYGGMLAGTATDERPQQLRQLAQSLHEVYGFLSRIELPANDRASANQRMAQMHAIDHLLRFRSRLEDLSEAHIDLTEPAYHWALQDSQQTLELAQRGLTEQDLAPYLPQLELNAVGLTSLSRQVRHDLLDDSAATAQNAAQVLAKTDTYRWLERTGHHIWRICFHLAQGRHAPATPGLADTPEVRHPPGQV